MGKEVRWSRWYILCSLLLIFMVGLLCKEALLYIVHLFLQLKARKARVLQTSLRILVDLIVDGVFSTCSCKFVYVFHISLMLLNWTDEVVKFELMFWHAQLFSLFNFNVFYCLERIQIVCLPSLAPPLSSLIIHHQIKASALTPTLPLRSPCENCAQSPHLELHFHQLPPKTPKIIKSTPLSIY